MLDISIDDKIFINDKLSAAIQELDILFNTENTELIGDTDYGTNWHQFLWDLNPSTEYLKEYIQIKLFQTYFLSQYNFEITVDFEQGTERAIYYVKIELYDANNELATIQQYELK